MSLFLAFDAIAVQLLPQVDPAAVTLPESNTPAE